MSITCSFIKVRFILFPDFLCCEIFGLSRQRSIIICNAAKKCSFFSNESSTFWVTSIHALDQVQVGLFFKHQRKMELVIANCKEKTGQSDVIPPSRLAKNL